MAHPETYAHANQLVWDPSFAPAVRCFLGPGRADYIDEGGAVADQMLDMLGGPPDKPQRIGNYLRFTACRPRSCPEKGAIVVERDGAIVALAILHSGCAIRDRPDCFARMTLTIFVRDPTRMQSVIDNLSGWAEVAVLRDPHTTGALDRVEVLRVSH